MFLHCFSHRHVSALPRAIFRLNTFFFAGQTIQLAMLCYCYRWDFVHKNNIALNNLCLTVFYLYFVILYKTTGMSLLKVSVHHVYRLCDAVRSPDATATGPRRRHQDYCTRWRTAAFPYRSMAITMQFFLAKGLEMRELLHGCFGGLVSDASWRM